MTDAQTFVADLAATWGIGSKLKLPDATIDANACAIGVYGALRAVPQPDGAVWRFPDKSHVFITTNGTFCHVLEESC